jgi:hypothetical protein
MSRLKLVPVSATATALLALGIARSHGRSEGISSGRSGLYETDNEIR